MSELHPGEPVHHMEEDSRHRLRETIFGVQDGLVSTMGVVTGVASGTGDRLVIILAGLVVIFVEALSMAGGSYLSSKSEAELEARMVEEERHEIQQHPEKERQELEEYYRERGFSAEETKRIADRFMQDEDLLLEEMMHRELGVHPRREEHPMKNAGVMWLAYMVGGSVPLLPYLLFAPAFSTLVVSVSLTALALFLVGAWKGRMVELSTWRSGAEMALVGMGAATIGYLVGYLVGHLLGLGTIH